MIQKKRDLIQQLQLSPATLNDYPTIQNMARFYVYDLSRECGFISQDWALPSDGLFESFDFKNYFEEPTRRTFLIKVNEELAGFVLLNQVCTAPETLWNMGEFFIIAKFQSKGIGHKVAFQIWDQFPGKWEVSVIPENKSALKFWQRTIADYTGGQYQELRKTIDYDKDQPQRIIFMFEAIQSKKPTA